MGLGLLSQALGLDGGSSSDHGAQISACQDAVRSKLKSPSTASFGDATVRDRQAGGVVINGPVDSENGFGAMIRSAYVCDVDDSGFVTDSTILDGGG
jgi:hypothetical protein